MTRIPLIPSDDPDAVRYGVFSSFAAEQREPIDLYRALANVPELLLAYRSLPQHLRHAAVSPRRLRELAVLRVAQLVGSAYEWSHHRPMAMKAGVSEAQIDALASWRSSDRFDADERPVLAAVDAIHDLRLSDAEFTALEERLGRHGAVEIVVAVAQYEATARIIQALGVDVEPSYAPYLTGFEPFTE
ncbi:MAG TPA: carboxymuconolactone decarboxylase family protein [Streptomyces sp.]|uniref:carboxymuconolactone decarboxylase family protein n=1 Tax=Streptomyces sp. TaxID=1931 RepID=UPI002CCBF1E3|nr:carboxymuconolactone decarboxylase family protein [Streptomyces sp.]HWU11833.1 carboxymuconolactone decarboxylase family protein [Streptomyces sp.]